MRQLAFALTALALAALPWGSSAQTTPTVYVFTTVDAVDVASNQLTITGIEQGAAAPSTRLLSFGSSSEFNAADLETCHRMALLAMSKPGQYLLSVRNYQTYYNAGCKLTRVNP